jgi:hypothetical protein
MGALDALPNGPVERDALLNTNLITDKDAGDAALLEWYRKVSVDIHPGMTGKERKKALEAAKANQAIPAFVMMWNAIKVLLEPGGPDKSGWLEIGPGAELDFGPFTQRSKRYRSMC